MAIGVTVRSFSVVMPDGREFFHEINRPYPSSLDCDAEDAARVAVSCCGLTTERSNPVAIECVVSLVKIAGGEMQRQNRRTVKIIPPFKSMTQDEFNAEETDLLAKLPEAFRSFVSSYAWENGHASGREEVIGIVGDLVDKLMPCIAEYDSNE